MTTATLDDPIDEVPVDPARARVYAEGWQSWSPATWYPASAAALRPDADWQHIMRFRPGTPIARDALQAEGLLVVDPGDGSPARCYGAGDPVVVPTITATLVADRVVVRSNGALDSTQEADAETALAEYAEGFARRARAGALGHPRAEPPTVWCSWYRYFEEVTAADVLENLRSFDDHDLVVDVVQVDDGWSPGLGEGLVVADRFGSLEAVLDAVRATGRRAGIWVAPFLVGTRSTLASEHPDWLVGPAGRNWEDELVGLDLTHSGVLDLLAETFTRLVDLGVDYLKLDFLYGGAVPGRRVEDMTGEEAYRSGLSLIREVVGPEVYLVGCGAPLLPSVGLVDAMRVSPDTFHEGGEDGSHGLRGLMPLAARAWQQGRLWLNDPDCLVARPTYAERDRWAGAVRDFGGLASFSDRVADLDDSGLRIVRDLLARGGTAEPFGADTVRHGAAVAADERAARGAVRP
jgi:alpha-galactosidase